MTLDIVRLLNTSCWRAFDVDHVGRVLAGHDATGSVQLVEIAPDGSTTALTELPGAVSGRYLPGERTVVIQHDTDGDERSQLSLLELDGTDQRPATMDDLTPLVRDPRHVHRLLSVLPGRVVYATNRRNGVDFDVIIRNALTGEEQVVYDDGGLVLDVTVSADSNYVLITLPGEPPMSGQIKLINTMPATADEQLRALTPADDDARNTQLAWLPDASGIILTSNHGRDLTGIARLDPRTGVRHWLVTSEEHEISGWLSPDGDTLLVQTNDNGSARLSLHEASTGALRHRVELPADGWCTFPMPPPVFSPDSRFVALSFTAPGVPGDVLRLSTEDGSVRALTDSARQLDGARLGEPGTHSVTTPDGESVPCFTYSPTDVGVEPDGSAVLIIHGGPESQSVRGFNPLVQALLHRGHTVVVPNVRGSTGYGKRWYSADDQRRRLDSVADLAALHDWLPAIGVDPTRVALFGGSYGGYMVLAGLAFQPERWAAGVSVVGISSLCTFLANTAGYRRAHREREYGSSEHDAEFLRSASPLYHVAAIAAPLLVIHGANDPRVPLSEAEQLTEAVRAKGLECTLRVYPDEGHGLAKRANRLDAYPRVVRFLDRLLSG